MTSWIQILWKRICVLTHYSNHQTKAICSAVWTKWFCPRKQECMCKCGGKLPTNMLWDAFCNISDEGHGWHHFYILDNTKRYLNSNPFVCKNKSVNLVISIPPHKQQWCHRHTSMLALPEDIRCCKQVPKSRSKKVALNLLAASMHYPCRVLLVYTHSKNTQRHSRTILYIQELIWPSLVSFYPVHLCANSELMQMAWAYSHNWNRINLSPEWTPITACKQKYHVVPWCLESCT